MSKEHEDNLDDELENEFDQEDHEDTAAKGDKTAEELAAEKKAQEDADAQEAADAAERAKKYRPSEEDDKEKGKEKEKETDPEHVPLSVYLQLKNDFKELKKSLESDTLTQKELDELAEESGLDAKVLQKIIATAKIQAKQEALKEVDAKVKPIVSQKISSDNDRFFSDDFEQTIAKKYPELADKKDNFKRIAFSKDFMHLKTLEDIRKEFYPNAKSTKEAAVKTEAPEGGSKGTEGKELESIDFGKMDEATHKKVLADPKLKAKYYAWQDKQGL